jgi:pimeloyl-ACP methyl ester carboxylesterase
MTDDARGGIAAGRDDVTFVSGDGHCAAWLYRPHATHRPPIIVMGHGFGAVRELRLDAYAERFAEAGYAVLVFDYRHFGASSGEPRELLDLSRQHEDWRSALTYARSLDWAENSPVIAWGSSLGGGHVLHAAANDHGLAAVIAQVPHVSGPVATRSLGIRHASALALAGLRDQANHLLGRSPYYRQSIGDADTGAVMVEPDWLDLLHRLAGDEIDEARLRSQNRVAARVLLHMPFYSPGRTAHRITAPTLVQAGEHDQLTPPSASRAVAERIPKAEFKIYSCGHFDPYLPPHFDGIMSDQIAFLRIHVPVAS